MDKIKDYLLPDVHQKLQTLGHQISYFPIKIVMVSSQH